jgi:hypothetical protein
MGRIGRARIETALAWEYCAPNLLAAYELAFQLRPRSRLSFLGRRISQEPLH